MTSFEKTAVAFLSVIAIGLIGAALWLYEQKWQKPLGPALQTSIVTPFEMPPTWTPDPDSTTPPLSTPITVSVTQTSLPIEPIATSTGLCGLPSAMNILAVGSDTRAEDYTYGLADVIRLVHIDSVTPKVTVLEIPRDLWVEIPDIADNLNGQDHEKLNQAYLYGNPGFGYTNDPAHGPGLLARTLTQNFGTRIDHYIAANMYTFVKLVDAVGGLDINLPEAVDGRTATDTNSRLLFPQGDQHLNGTQALTLARIRIQGVFVRADNQNLVLCALRKKLLTPKVIKNIPNIIKAFQGAVQTDFSPAQLGQLACLGTQLQSPNIIFTSFPEDLFTQDRIYDPVFKKSLFVWNADYDILRKYIKQFDDGTWPPPTVATISPNHKKGDSQICQ